MHVYTSYYRDDDIVTSSIFKVTAVLEIKCFEVTVVLNAYHKPTPITTCSMCIHVFVITFMWLQPFKHTAAVHVRYFLHPA